MPEAGATKLGVIVKRILALLVLVLVGFYIVWPAYSAYRIANALTTQDEGTLASKVDFPAVRDSLRPIATVELGKQFDQQTSSLGALGQVLGGDVKSQMLGPIVEQALQLLVTPTAVIRIANEGGELSASIAKAIGEAGARIGAPTDGAARGGTTGGLGGMAGLGGLAGQVLGNLKKPGEARLNRPRPQQRRRRRLCHKPSDHSDWATSKA